MRLGVIGTNWITDRFVEAARETGRCEVTAVLSRTAERAGVFADKLDIPHRYSELEAFAASEAFDAVYIASPNAQHAAYAIACMNRGKAVLCEKPFASNVRESEEMIAAAKRNGVLLMEAMITTHLPNFTVIRDNLHKLGTIRRYFASYCQYSSRYDAFKEGNILNAFLPAYANGSLMDIGVYCVYPLIVLFGQPDRIQANAYLLSTGVDGEGSMLLHYERGMEAVLMYSKVANSYAPAEIQGENGTMVIDAINKLGQVAIHYRDGTVEELGQPQNNAPMTYELVHFIDLWEKGAVESPINTWQYSLQTMAVMDEARRQVGVVYPADR